MNTAPPPPPAPARTRARFAAFSIVLVAACTVSATVIGMLADRYAVRADVTATREQALSPRTAGLLDSLAGPYEIVIAADWGALDGRASQRVRDVLDLFTRESRLVTSSVLDTATAAGAASYERLLRRLSERDAPKVSATTEAVAAAIAAAQEMAADLRALSPRFQAVRDALPGEPASEKNRQFFEFQSAQCRVNADLLADIATKSREALEAPPGPLGAPDFEQAGDPLRKNIALLEAGLRQLGGLVRDFASADSTPAPARALAQPLAADLARLRDAAAVHADALARLPRLDTVRVARTLQATQAALVIGPPDAGLTAVPFEWLFPPDEAAATGNTHADLRRRTEELFSTAIDSLARPVNPILVIVHSWPPPPLLDRQRGFGSLVERLGLRGIDTVEWSVTTDPEPPSLATLDPDRRRPVVYAVFNFDTSAGSAAGLTGPERADRLGAAVTRLIDEGKPVLLSIVPSALPTFGSPDRVTAGLPAFGLRADSARPLLRATLTPAGRAVHPDVQVLPGAAEHPIAGAVRGLRVLLEWPVPLVVLPEADAPRARVWPLLTLDDRAAWAEAEWQDLWVSTRARPPVTPRQLPSPDSSRDDTAGRWVLAAAAERSLPEGRGTQRIVAVSANEWFTDRVTTQRARLVDGRIASANPGNIELVEAAVSWLAGQDDRIGASATARAVPVVRPLDPGPLAVLRWTVILGLPVLTLAAGVLWRFWRG